MKTSIKRLAITALLCVFGINLAHADDFTARLNKKFPTTVNAKVAAAWPGFHSVVKGKEILYFNDDLTIMINGEVRDLNRNASLTEELRIANQPKVSIADIKLEDTIKLTSGSRKLFVFSDLDCPYCKRLENEFANLKDVEIRIIPWPIHQTAVAPTEAIWCSNDRAAAWNAWFALGQKPTPATCSNPIARNNALAQKLQVMGTPTLIFEDGTMIGQAISADQINAKIASLGSKQ